MSLRSGPIRRFVRSLACLGLLGGLFVMSRQPALSKREAANVAGRFRFEKLPLPELPHVGPARQVRDVHPSLQRFRSWISFVGAAVSLTDLDGDGLPNDLAYVDPRIDQVIVAPAPGTRDRFGPFALVPGSLPFDPRTMAPMGSRVGDFDEDGYPDILVYYWGRSPVLFLQRPDPIPRGPVVLSPESFVARELVEPYQIWYTSAVGQADLDGDGHVDVFLGNYNPDGSHVLDPTGTGIEEMMHSMSRAYNGGKDRVFLWDGGSGSGRKNAHFREVADVLEHDVACGWTLGIGTADLDGDLLPEVYIVQDFGPDRLLHNRSVAGKPGFAVLNGRRSFTTPRSLVVGGDSFNGMGVDFGDLNGDGLTDIFVSNITCDYGLHESNFVFLRTGPSEDMARGIAPFEDASERLGLSRAGWTWDVKLGDFDNDGVLEVVQAAGFTKGAVNRWPELHELALGNDELMADPRFYHRIEPADDVSGNDHDAFFVRMTDGRYADLATRVGLGTPMHSRGIAPADVDGDGRLDFAVANNWERSFLFHNLAPGPGSFLGLHLRLPVERETGLKTSVRSGHPQRWSEGPSRPALGAAVTVHLPGGRTLVAQVDGGNGHSGQRAPDLHFGLGTLAGAGPLRVDVRWRDGDGRVRNETFMLEPGRWHTILLGEPGGPAGEKTS